MLAIKESLNARPIQFQHIDRLSREHDNFISLRGVGWVNHELYYAALAFAGCDSGRLDQPASAAPLGCQRQNLRTKGFAGNSYDLLSGYHLTLASPTATNFVSI